MSTIENQLGTSRREDPSAGFWKRIKFAFFFPSDFPGWKRFTVIWIAILALLGWGTVFFNGITLRDAPFRQVVNLVSVKVPGQIPANLTGQKQNPLSWIVNRFSSTGSEQVPASPASQGEQKGDIVSPADLARKQSPKSESYLTNEKFAVQKIPQTLEKQSEPDEVNIDRIKLYFKIWGIESDRQVIILSWLLGLLGYPYTNLLLLTWLSATLGSLVNFTVCELRRIESGRRIHQSPLRPRSLTSSIVIGAGLGFTMYLAIVGGATVITKSGLSVTSPDDYANKAAIISLLTLLAALYPGWFLRVIHVRLRDAGGDGQHGEAKPTSGPSPSGAGLLKPSHG